MMTAFTIPDSWVTFDSVIWFFSVMSIGYYALTIIAPLVGVAIVVLLLYALFNALRPKKQLPITPVQTSKPKKTNDNTQPPTREEDSNEIQRKDSEGNLVTLHWDEIATVQIITLDRNKTIHWAFMALQNETQSKSILIPHLDPEAKPIFDRLCLLPNFDRVALSQTLSAPGNQRKTLWQKTPVPQEAAFD